MILLHGNFKPRFHLAQFLKILLQVILYLCTIIFGNNMYPKRFLPLYNRKSLKMNLLKSSFIALCLLIASAGKAQEAPNKTDASGKKQGHWIKYDANKKKIFDGNFLNDKPIGKFTYYYPSGEIKAINTFMKNSTVSYAEYYHLTGKIMGKGKYVNEQKDSTWIFYDEEGVLLSQDNYLNGKKHGSCKVYYRNGQVSEDKTWKNGVLDGPAKKYFEDGQLKYEGQYVAGKVEGKVTYYHPNGKIDAVGVYKNDLKEGDWKYYKDDGTLLRVDKYINGTIQGGDKNIITKEQQDKEKKQYEQYDLKNPYEEGYQPK